MLGSPTAQAVCTCTRQYSSAARFVYTRTVTCACTHTQACTLLPVCCCLRSTVFKSQRKSIEISSTWIHFQYTAIQSFNAHTFKYRECEKFIRQISSKECILLLRLQVCVWVAVFFLRARVSSFEVRVCILSVLLWCSFHSESSVYWQASFSPFLLST